MNLHFLNIKKKTSSQKYSTISTAMKTLNSILTSRVLLNPQEPDIGRWIKDRASMLALNILWDSTKSSMLEEHLFRFQLQGANIQRWFHLDSAILFLEKWQRCWQGEIGLYELYPVQKLSWTAKGFEFVFLKILGWCFACLTSLLHIKQTHIWIQTGLCMYGRRQYHLIVARLTLNIKWALSNDFGGLFFMLHNKQ